MIRFIALLFFALCAQAQAQVAFDAASHANKQGGAATTLTWTHTPVGTPSAIAVSIVNWEGGGTVTGVTYGGSALTLAASTGGTGADNYSAQIWCRPNPASGAQSVVITFSATFTFADGGAVSVTGSDTSTCFTASNTALANGTTANVTVAGTSTSELTIDVFGNNDANPAASPSAPQTLRWADDAPSTQGAGSSRTSAAANTTMTWTWGGAGIDWRMAAASFKAAGAGPTVSTRRPLSGVGP